MITWALAAALALPAPATVVPATVAETAMPDHAQVMALPPELRSRLQEEVIGKGRSDLQRLELLVDFMFDEQGLKPGGPFNGALACDNVERTYEELTARGVEFLAPPTKQPWGMFAMFKDVDGNQFVLSSR